MLVLGRKLNEQINITTPSGEQITITLVGIKRNVMRLGIDAPKEYKILRSELENDDGSQQRQPVQNS